LLSGFWIFWAAQSKKGVLFACRVLKFQMHKKHPNPDGKKEPLDLYFPQPQVTVSSQRQLK